MGKCSHHNNILTAACCGKRYVPESDLAQVRQELDEAKGQLVRALLHHPVAPCSHDGKCARPTVEICPTQLEQVRQERDEKHQMCAKLADEIFGLVKERDTLRVALQKYGQHAWKCAALAHPIAVGEVAIAKSEKAIERSVKKLQKLVRQPLACTCGLTDALGGMDG